MDPDRVWIAVAAIIENRGRVLALRRAASSTAFAGAWETLSGRVADDEDPLEAVRREIVEESGLDVELERRPFDVYRADRSGTPMLVVVYVARYVGGEVKLSDEHDAFEWCTADAFEERTPWPRLAEVVRAVTRRSGG